jgi:hypothetical protein
MPPAEAIGIVPTNTAAVNSASPTHPATASLEASDKLLNALGGIPPNLSISLIDGQPALTIHGVANTTCSIQISTNIVLQDAWISTPEIVLTNSDQMWQADDSMPEGFTVCRIITPWDYAVQADQLLRTKNYATCLIEVCTPGLTAYRVCYMPAEGGYLDYDLRNKKFLLIPSGASIREIAAKVAASRSENWAYASEFTFTHGLKRSIATVVKTDPPGYGPAPLGASGGIKIDF